MKNGDLRSLQRTSATQGPQAALVTFLAGPSNIFQHFLNHTHPGDIKVINLTEILCTGVKSFIGKMISHFKSTCTFYEHTFMLEKINIVPDLVTNI